MFRFTLEFKNKPNEREIERVVSSYGCTIMCMQRSNRIYKVTIAGELKDINHLAKYYKLDGEK